MKQQRNEKKRHTFEPNSRNVKEPGPKNREKIERKERKQRNETTKKRKKRHTFEPKSSLTTFYLQWVNPDGEVELYPSKKFIPGDKDMYILSNALVWRIDNPSYPVISNVKEPGPKNREKLE
ncbi:unnamed protein product [Rhizophagus irregularis]|nr:unnamed protein product [Rhizophagus irregularis]